MHQNQVMDDFSEASIPGKWLVDSLPFLQYLPTWLPGMTFKRLGLLWRGRAMDAMNTSFDFAVKQVENHNAKLSLVSEVHKKHDGALPAETSRDLKWTAFSLYAGGSDTTACTMEVFFLEMALHPEAQRKAQAEIDQVVGKNRLPTVADRPQLPYLDALIKECKRWEPIGSLSIPHVAAEDDEIDGYFIPKGAILLPHIAGIYKDPAVYKDPTVFRPERFLGKEPEMDPNDLIWGFGRRVCPGRFLATQSLFLAISNTLACFKIDSIAGKEPKVEFAQGLINHPLPFEVDLRVRSEEHEALVRDVQAMEGGVVEKGDSHLL
jgi:cytochrome P450